MSEERLINAFKRLLQKLLLRHPYGFLYRFRVASMVGNRVQLEAHIDHGMPAPRPAEMRPGMAGLSAELTPGTEVLVTYIEGNPSLPMITHYAPAGADGFVPLALVVGDPQQASPVARKGDTVDGSWLLFTGQGTLSLAPPNAPNAIHITGTIDSGSALLSSQ